jgi:hypothetical protein
MAVVSETVLQPPFAVALDIDLPLEDLSIAKTAAEILVT